MSSAKQTAELHKFRGNADVDQTLLPAKDPFADTPIQFNNENIHDFKRDDLDKLSDADAHEVLKRILLTLRHTVRYDALDLDRVVKRSNGLRSVLTLLGNRLGALPAESPFKLTGDEKGYIRVAKRKFSKWNFDAKERKKKRSGA